MLKILQSRLRQFKNGELADVQVGLQKGRGTRDQIANICWIIKKAREFQKNIYFCFIDYAKAFDCVDQYTCNHSSLDFLPVKVTTEHWIEFPVLYGWFTLVIYLIHSSISTSIPFSQFILPPLSPNDTCTPMFMAALFIIARTQKQPICPMNT